MRYAVLVISSTFTTTVDPLCILHPIGYSSFWLLFTAVNPQLPVCLLHLRTYRNSCTRTNLSFANFKRVSSFHMYVPWMMSDCELYSPLSFSLGWNVPSPCNPSEHEYFACALIAYVYGVHWFTCSTAHDTTSQAANMSPESHVRIFGPCSRLLLPPALFTERSGKCVWARLTYVLVLVHTVQMAY